MKAKRGPGVRPFHDPGYYFRRYLKAWPIAHSLWRAFECERFSCEVLKPPVADLGCGDGFFAQVTYGRPLDVGIDMDEGEVQRALACGAYRKVLQADVRHLPLKASSMNTVISNCVFEHIPGVQEVFAEVARVLRPGGRIFFTVPSEYFEKRMLFPAFLARLGFPDLGRAWRDTLNRVFKHHHLNEWREWGKRLKKAGLVLERVDPVVPLPVYHSWERWLVPALPSLVFRSLFGRRILFPRLIASWLAPWWFRQELRTDPDSPEGAGYFIIARKARR